MALAEESGNDAGNEQDQQNGLGVAGGAAEDGEEAGEAEFDADAEPRVNLSWFVLGKGGESVDDNAGDAQPRNRDQRGKRAEGESGCQCARPSFAKHAEDRRPVGEGVEPEFPLFEHGLEWPSTCRVFTMMKSEAEQMETLSDLVKDIEVAMMTTFQDDGQLRSRPMATQAIEGKSIWFFTSDHSHKVKEIERDARVNLGYSGKGAWVSVSGRASVKNDPAKIDELWKESLTAWFPQGKATPGLALLLVHIESAEYWDVTSSAMVTAYAYLKSKLTGETAKDLGDHGVIST